MEKSIFKLHIFLMHPLVFLNFLLKRVESYFQCKNVTKKKMFDNCKQIKKTLRASHEQIQLFQAREYVQHYKTF